jgi:hypothetical protein
MNRLHATLVGIALACGLALPADARSCLGMSGQGPLRAGMTVEQALSLFDWSGMETQSQAQECWYLRYQGGGNDFDAMIIQGKVVRIELRGKSTLRTFSGAHIGTTEAELKKMYGARLDIQPHKYDEHGHTITVRSSSGEYGLRFETSQGKVTAIQSGPWEHLNYVEGCS